jgi:hypothetical protein
MTLNLSHYPKNVQSRVAFVNMTTNMGWTALMTAAENRDSISPNLSISQITYCSLCE